MSHQLIISEYRKNEEDKMSFWSAQKGTKNTESIAQNRILQEGAGVRVFAVVSNGRLYKRDIYGLLKT